MDGLSARYLGQCLDPLSPAALEKISTHLLFARSYHFAIIGKARKFSEKFCVPSDDSLGRSETLSVRSAHQLRVELQRRSRSKAIPVDEDTPLIQAPSVNILSNRPQRHMEFSRVFPFLVEIS
ncbi:hypothetical protein AVEN_18742-1 [Araneus ventricosus]|uniref:Uncharacterized protein n=1 Tax=Araneus ventricosus TaxID=182803 RepID=A0A4Y2GJH4_ARAVE|nr:hypothetical protein AVEN_18742-1 [Araneus ventricosus]